MLEIMPYLPGFLAAYSILFVGALSPGPSVAMLIAIATRQGRAPALSATFGIAFGSVTINALTLVGVGLLLSQAAWAMSLLRIIGSAYLLYLAYKAFAQALHPSTMQSVNAEKQNLLNHFISGYLLQVTNPKAIAFWLAIASIGAVDGASTSVIAVFVFGAFLISFACHGAWAVALSEASIRASYIKGKRWIECALGSFFSFAAYKLLTSEP